MSETSAVTFCATLIDEWVRLGMADAVVSPGSRSTPMALALVADGRLYVHMHHDERSAGYVALGIAMASRRPALVVTTSGTAAVELHPAVVEAHEAAIPMVICTADRPPELHGVGAPQTIDQQHLFGGSVRAFIDVGVPDSDRSETWRTIAFDAWVEATQKRPGPVHLNVAFREPLVGEAGALPQSMPHADETALSTVSSLRRQSHDVGIDRGLLDEVVAAITGRRGLIIAGGRVDDPSDVLSLAQAVGWPIVADPRSGCRTVNPYVIAHVDEILRVPEMATSLRPDIVIRFGSLPASKVLGQWLADIDAYQLGVDVDGLRFDPDHSLDRLIGAGPGAFCRALTARLGEVQHDIGRWVQNWTYADSVASAAIAEVVAAHGEPTEPGIAREVVAAMPDGATLVVSSSMPIRDVEWYSAPRSGIEVLANRGANGIDGVVSTAVGIALVADRRSTNAVNADSPVGTALLIGDVALLHDTNGLLGVVARMINLTIVVVDNDGGGIFSFLPQATAVDFGSFEQLYGTPHGVDIVALAAAHGIDSTIVDRQADVRLAVAESLTKGGTRLVLIRTDRQQNVAVHEEIHGAVITGFSRGRN
ncbi:MAG: 2-succinyl-5-enolpyruvyl-6-hydroxy-3-cyclohexene-1-carboxylic-acid synthase [Actinomycetes bacterium]